MAWRSFAEGSVWKQGIEREDDKRCLSASWCNSSGDLANECPLAGEIGKLAGG